MSIVVGREGDQPFKIDNPGVSRKHVQVEDLGNGLFLLEDLNSSNGTFVNNQKIIKKTVSLKDDIRLGATYPLSLQQLFPTAIVAQPKQEVSKQSKANNESKQEMTAVSIRHLRNIRERYEYERTAILKEASTSQVKRMLPPIIVSAVLLVISLFLDGSLVAIVRPVVAIVGVVLLAYMTYKHYQVQASKPERLERAKKQYQIDYVCPQCKAFLGDLPFENIQNQGKCSKCKTVWQ